MILRDLRTRTEMMETFSLLQSFYPKLTIDLYHSDLENMIKHSYGQVAIFEEDTCLGVSGYWLGTKLWCGKYLELDNIVVHETVRNKGIGKMLSDYLKEKAAREHCTILALDSYTDNFEAHKFFYREGFIPRGFHFIKVLQKDGIR